MGEAGYLRNYHKEDPGLPGTYRLGGFYHTGGFSDQRCDARGRLLADPLSSGIVTPARATVVSTRWPNR